MKTADEAAADMNAAFKQATDMVKLARTGDHTKVAMAIMGVNPALVYDTLLAAVFIASESSNVPGVDT